MDTSEEGGKVVAFPAQGHPALGVPFDGDAFDRVDAFYQAIDRGEHDAELDGIEQAANFRKRDRSHPRMEVWTGPAPDGWRARIAAGYYDCQGREGMQMILGAVRNRRIVQHNADLVVTRDRLKAEAPKLRVGDRVRVRLDMPANRAGEILLGKIGTVQVVKRTNVIVCFDDGQALGRFAAKGRRVNMQMWTLELLADAAMQRVAAADAKAAVAPAAPARGQLVRADLFVLSPAHAAVLAELVLLEVESIEHEGGDQAEANDLSDLYQRLDDYAKAART